MKLKGEGPISKKINYKALDGISLEQKKLILKLMARVSEASFRRGYQHGQDHANSAAISGYDLRYGKNKLTLDLSKEPIVGFRTIHSIDRLSAEHGRDLSFVGLDVESVVRSKS
jgi:hypothetical protein